MTVYITKDCRLDNKDYKKGTTHDSLPDYMVDQIVNAGCGSILDDASESTNEKPNSKNKKSAPKTNDADFEEA